LLKNNKNKKTKSLNVENKMGFDFFLKNKTFGFLFFKKYMLFALKKRRLKKQKKKERNIDWLWVQKVWSKLRKMTKRLKKKKN